MCVGCEVTTAAGGISGITAMLASSVPLTGVFILKFSRWCSVSRNAQQKNNFLRLGALLAGYQFSLSLLLGIIGLALGDTSTGKVVITAGLLLFILLWIWCSWIVARRAKTWSINHSLICSSLGASPLIGIYTIPYILYWANLNHQLFLLTPILPEYSLQNLLMAFLSILIIPAMIWTFQKLNPRVGPLGIEPRTCRV